MALVVKDRVRETSTTAGTGALTLNGAVSGFQSFSVIGDGNTTYYTIVDAGTGAWEVGIGIYTLSTTNLSRDTVLESSNSGSLVNFGSNLKDVFVTYPAERSIYTDAAGTAITPATASVLGVASGGTGQSTYTNGQLLIGNTTGNTLTKATLTAGTGISITNGTGSITVAATNNGDVIGPASSTDNAIARFDSTTGKIIQNSGVIVDDSNNVTGVVGQTMSGNLTFTGTGNRITGDFSNATLANRVWLQTSTANSAFSSGVLPSGTATRSLWAVVSQSDPTNASTTELDVENGLESRFRASRFGTGSYLPMTFYTGGSERMRIDTSGNVGIGTSSPSYKLSISGGSATSSNLLLTHNTDSTGAYSRIRFQFAEGNTSIASEIRNIQRAAGENGTSLAFFTDSNAGSLTERMRIDSAGNVGIGTSSPTALRTRNLEVSSGGTNDGAAVIVGKRGSGVATLRLTGLDTTVGTDINFNFPNTGDLGFFDRASSVNRMVIDSSGNVGIGTSSPATRLALLGAGTTSTSYTNGDAAGATLTLQDSAGSSGNGGQILFGASQGFYAGIKGFIENGTGPAGSLLFQTRTTSGNIVERMRIDSSGKVGIGRTPISQRLEVNTSAAVYAPSSTTGVFSIYSNGQTSSEFTLGQGTFTTTDNITFVWNRANAAQTFGSNNTERMRIHAGGNVTIGATTDTGARLSVYAPANTGCLYLESDASNSVGGQITMANTGRGAKYIRVDTGNELQVVNDAYTAVIFRLTNAGAAFKGDNTTTWSTVSDIRIKENIRPVTNALDKICALNPCHFEYKTRLGETATGFIAQEYEQVLPEHVFESLPGMEFSSIVPADEKIKGINPDLVPYLVKAIQEIRAEINQLKGAA
jgi:hypothetical protein